MVSSCGTDLRPGTAATVDGTDISQSKVDDMVEAACNYLHVQNAGNAQAAPLTVKDARANVAALSWRSSWWVTHPTAWA